jgi:hypothetical protein
MQRAMFWMAMIVCFSAADIPILSRSIEAGSGEISSVSILLAISVVGYTTSLIPLHRLIWPELESGTDPADQDSPIFNLTFLQYPPHRRIDLIVWDCLGIAALLYAINGSWLVVE